MDSHVSGGITPPNLAKLRRAIYALLGDQLLFSEAEQLQLSLDAHECADARLLRAQLSRLQHEADRRLRVLGLQQQAQQPGRPLAKHRTQRFDLRRLARETRREIGTDNGLFGRLGRLAWHLEVATTAGRRAALVGDAYALLLPATQPARHELN